MRRVAAALLLLLAATAAGEAASLRLLPNQPLQYDFGDQRALPPTFGRGELTFELWIRPDASFPVGEVARGTLGQLTNWSDFDPPPYSSHGWWLAGNWLLDGHSRPEGYGPFDSRAGTFSLQLYGGGRVRWTFADDARVVPVGKVWAVQAGPATEAPSLLDGKWHHLACVRRWAGEREAQLELWVDGKLIATEPIPQRVDMRRFWDHPPHPDDPPELGGWAWGSEVMTAWGMYFTQYEDYKGLVDEIRFWDRARSPEELARDWDRAVRGDEPGLVGWIPFDEGSGSTARDRLDPARGIELHRASAESWAGEDAPVRVGREAGRS